MNSDFRRLFFDGNFIVDGSVSQIRLNCGFGYRIEARVLSYLRGYVYLIPDVEGWIMIDAGCGNSESNADIERGFRTIREEYDSSFSPDNIRLIALTHAHVDHFGGANEFRTRSQARVAVHFLERRVVENYYDVANVENCKYSYFLLEAGVPDNLVEHVLGGFGFKPQRALPTHVDRVLFGGERLGTLQAICFPGHSSGHLAYLCGDVLFSGDILLSRTLSQLWPTRMMAQTGFLQYIRSLIRLKKLALRHEKTSGKKLIAFPGHEEPIFDIPGRVDRVLRSMERRNARLLKLFSEAGVASLWEILPKMYWSAYSNREFFALSDIGSRVEFLLQLNLLKVANAGELRFSAPVVRYSCSLADAETAENTVEKIVRLSSTGD